MYDTCIRIESLVNPCQHAIAFHAIALIKAMPFTQLLFSNTIMRHCVVQYFAQAILYCTYSVSLTVWYLAEHLVFPFTFLEKGTAGFLLYLGDSQTVNLDVQQSRMHKKSGSVQLYSVGVRIICKCCQNYCMILDSTVELDAIQFQEK